MDQPFKALSVLVALLKQVANFLELGAHFLFMVFLLYAGKSQAPVDTVELVLIEHQRVEVVSSLPIKEGVLILHRQNMLLRTDLMNQQL